jgi:hypothetical protein
MDTLRLDVTPRGKGYVAKSSCPELTALGSSPEDAAENARLMAIVLFATAPGPATLIVRLEEPGVCTIVMQPVEKPFSLAAASEKPEWRSMASVTNVGGSKEAAGE